MPTLYRLQCGDCSFAGDVAGYHRAQADIDEHEKHSGHQIRVFKVHRAGQLLYEIFNFQHSNQPAN